MPICNASFKLKYLSDRQLFGFELLDPDKWLKDPIIGIAVNLMYHPLKPSFKLSNPLLLKIYAVDVIVYIPIVL